MEARARDETRDERAESRLAAFALAALLAAIAFAAGFPTYIPTHDGPQHVYALHVANHLDDPARGWSDWFEIARPVTSLGFAAVFGPLDLLLPWPLALRCALTALALFWALAAWALARAIDPRRAWLGLALGGAAFSWPFYMGFFSFHLATSLGLFVLAWAIRARPETPGLLALLAALLGGVALFHVMSAVITGVALAALYWRRAPRGAIAATCARIAVIALPAAAVALALVAPGIDSLGDPSAPPPSSAAPPWWALAKCFAGGPAWRAWPLTLLALAAPLVALARWRAGRSAEDEALLIAGSAALAAAAFLPMDLSAWEYFAPRFLPIAVSALVLSLPIERLARAQRAAAALALASYALASTAWAWSYHEGFADASATALSGLDADLVRSGVRLPIVFDTGADPDVPPARAAMPFALPWVNLGQLYAASQGGVTPYGFTLNPRMHHLVARPDARAPALDRMYLRDLTQPDRGEDRAFRSALLTYLASRATEFEDVIFYGRPDEADLLRGLGFREDWRRAGLSIARFHGCPVRVYVSPRIARGAAREIEAGWIPARHLHARYDLAQGTAADDGSRVLPLRETCAGLWLRLVGGGPACDGADSEGRLLVASTRAAPDVICREPGETWTPPNPPALPAVAPRGDRASGGAATASRPAPSGSAARVAARSAR